MTGGAPAVSPRDPAQSPDWERGARVPPAPMPAVALSWPRQLLLAAAALILVAGLPGLAAVPSPHSAHFNPLAAYVGALLVGTLAFGLLPLWRRPVAALFLVAACVWFAAANGFGAGSVLLLTGLVTGVAMHLAVRQGLRDDLLIVLSIAVMATAAVVLYAVSGLVRGFDAWARLSTVPRHLVETSLLLVRSVLYPYGPLVAAEQQEVSWLEAQGETWIWLMPANALIAAAATLYLLTRAVRRRTPGLAERLPPFWAFSVTELAIWPLVTLCLLDAAAIHWDWMTARAVCDNLLWILVNLYMVCGLAIAHCFTLQLRFGPVMRVWTWCVLILFGGNLLAAAGLFDTWFHFRRWGARLASQRGA